MNYLGVNIKKIREYWGLTQEEFGLLIDATRGMIMQYEKRGTMPKGATVSKIIKVTGLSKDMLVNSEISEEDLYPLSQQDTLTISNFRDNPEDYFGSSPSDEELRELNSMKSTKIDSLQESLLAEKEARRQETEARLSKVDELNNRLLSILEERLLNIHNDQQIALAYQKAWVELHADEVAKGNPKEARAIMTKMNKLIASKLQVGVPSDNP